MRYIGRLSKLLWGLNVILLGTALFVIIISLIPESSEQYVPGTSGEEDVNKEPESPAGRHVEPIDVKMVQRRDLFRIGPDNVAKKPEAVAVGPATRARPELKRELPLRLLGTVVDEGGASYAILEDLGTKSQDVFRVGDVVANARIDGIQQNKVVLWSTGTRQTLSVDVKAKPSRLPVMVAQVPSAAQAVGKPGDVVKVVSGSQRQINARASSASRNRAAQMLRRMELSPHVADGQPSGLRISGLGDSSLARLVGLKDGDVIHAVNGHAVPNRRKAGQVLQKARRLGAARLQLTSGQQEKSLAFRTGSW